jgi:hypothetical protein
MSLECSRVQSCWCRRQAAFTLDRVDEVQTQEVVDLIVLQTFSAESEESSQESVDANSNLKASNTNPTVSSRQRGDYTRRSDSP